MGAFEYLSVLISIILALGMTRVLAGVGEMLQARSRHRIYWVHLIWIVNLFLYLVIAWWIFYRWRDQKPWNFYLFLFVLISPTILYLASLLLFPRESDVDTAIDYKAHYYANHRAFFILFALVLPADIIRHANLLIASCRGAIGEMQKCVLWGAHAASRAVIGGLANRREICT